MSLKVGERFTSTDSAALEKCSDQLFIAKALLCSIAAGGRLFDLLLSTNRPVNIHLSFDDFPLFIPEEGDFDFGVGHIELVFADADEFELSPVHGEIQEAIALFQDPRVAVIAALVPADIIVVAFGIDLRD